MAQLSPSDTRPYSRDSTPSHASATDKARVKAGAGCAFSSAHQCRAAPRPRCVQKNVEFLGEITQHTSTIAAQQAD